jgi:hypothetical protein
MKWRGFSSVIVKNETINRIDRLSHLKHNKITVEKLYDNLPSLSPIELEKLFYALLKVNSLKRANAIYTNLDKSQDMNQFILNTVTKYDNRNYFNLAKIAEEMDLNNQGNLNALIYYHTSKKDFEKVDYYLKLSSIGPNLKTIEIIIKEISNLDYLNIVKLGIITKLIPKRFDLDFLNTVVKAIGSMGYFTLTKTIILKHLQQQDLFFENNEITKTDAKITPLEIGLSILSSDIKAGKLNTPVIDLETINILIQNSIDTKLKIKNIDLLLQDFKPNPKILKQRKVHLKKISTDWDVESLLLLMNLYGIRPNNYTKVLVLESLTIKPKQDLKSHFHFLLNDNVFVGYGVLMKLLLAFEKQGEVKESLFVLEKLREMDIQPKELELILDVFVNLRMANCIGDIDNQTQCDELFMNYHRMIMKNRTKVSSQGFKNMCKYLDVLDQSIEKVVNRGLKFHSRDAGLLYRKMLLQKHDPIQLITYYNELIRLSNPPIIWTKEMVGVLFTSLNHLQKMNIYNDYKHMLQLEHYELLFEGEKNVDVLERLWIDFQDLGLVANERIMFGLRRLIQKDWIVRLALDALGLDTSKVF